MARLPCGVSKSDTVGWHGAEAAADRSTEGMPARPRPYLRGARSQAGSFGADGEAHALARQLHAGAHGAGPRGARSGFAGARAACARRLTGAGGTDARAGAGSRARRAALLGLLAGPEPVVFCGDPYGVRRLARRAHVDVCAPGAPEAHPLGAGRAREAPRAARLSLARRRSGEEGLRSARDERVPRRALQAAARIPALRGATGVARVSRRS